MSYRIVTFCAADRPEAVDEMRAMLALMFASAQRHDAGVSLTVLSDRETDLSGIEAYATISRHQVERSDLMLARTQAQNEFVGSYDFAQPLAFLDLDIFINRSIGPLFGRPFDIALTSRRKAEMPINGGVVLANNRNPPAVRSFFARLVDTYLQRYRAQSGWWGDQRALNDLVPLTQGQFDRELQLERDAIRYLMLPGSRYNFSPHVLWATVALPRPTKYILHFKGPARKKHFTRFFELHYRTPR